MWALVTSITCWATLKAVSKRRAFTGIHKDSIKSDTLIRTWILKTLTSQLWGQTYYVTVGICCCLLNESLTSHPPWDKMNSDDDSQCSLQKQKKRPFSRRYQHSFVVYATRNRFDPSSESIVGIWMTIAQQQSRRHPLDKTLFAPIIQMQQINHIWLIFITMPLPKLIHTISERKKSKTFGTFTHCWWILIGKGVVSTVERHAFSTFATFFVFCNPWRSAQPCQKIIHILAHSYMVNNRGTTFGTGDSYFQL